MPLYDFKNTETGEVFEKFVRLDERDQFLLDNPNLKQVPSALGFVSDPGSGWRNSLAKKHPSFVENMKRINRTNGGNIDTSVYSAN